MIQPSQQFSEFITWAFYGVVGFAALAVVHILGKLKDEVGVLNSKIAALLERTENHSKRLDEHSSRIRDLERPAG